jgi:hypothetical protein
MSGPDGRRRQPLSRGAFDHGHSRCGWRQPAALLGVEDAACGYSTPSNKVLLPKRVRGCVPSVAGPDAVVGTARALRSGFARSGRCSLTTSRLQRLATGAFLSEGRRRLWAAANTRRGSERRRPTTVTGGWLKLVKGCSGCPEVQRELNNWVTTSSRLAGMKPIEGVLGREAR